MYINIVNRRLFNQIDISYINTDFGKKSNGIAYIMQLGYNKSFTGSYKASFTNMGQNSLAIAVPVRCVKE